MKHNSQTSVVTDGLIKLSVADDVQEEQSEWLNKKKPDLKEEESIF